MSEFKLTLGNPGLAAHVLAVAAIKYEADDDFEAVGICNSMAAQITAQVNPAVEEPKEFGSIVRAGFDKHSDRVLWVRTPGGWYAETAHGFHAFFAGLHDPEVLRVGVRGPA